MRKSGNKINPFRQAKKKKVKETGKKRNKRKGQPANSFGIALDGYKGELK